MPATNPISRLRRTRGLLPLALVALAFLALSLPPYLSLDPANSRVPAPAGVALYFPALVAHVGFGAVAMLTCLLQLSPALRRRRPDLHRVVGRVYVLGGVLPAGLAGLYVAVHTPFGPTAGVSSVMLAALWLGTTVAGLRAARQRRLAAHRRWMIRSFALTMSIVLNRLFAVPVYLVLSTRLADEAQLAQAVASIVTWLGWTTALLLAEWWLERESTARPDPSPLGLLAAEG